jgi:hypothetical protein
MAQSITLGDRVRLARAFLRNTGQVKGGEGHSRWTVVACACGLCTHGGFVAVDERSMYADSPGNEDMPPQRHFNVANLERVR